MKSNFFCINVNEKRIYYPPPFYVHIIFLSINPIEPLFLYSYCRRGRPEHLPDEIPNSDNYAGEDEPSVIVQLSNRVQGE